MADKDEDGEATFQDRTGLASQAWLGPIDEVIFFTRVDTTNQLLFDGKRMNILHDPMNPLGISRVVHPRLD